MISREEINTLVERSTLSLGSLPASIPTEESNDDLILLKGSKNLTIAPVWETDDKIEGPLYLDHIKHNPGYEGIYLRKEVAEKLSEAAKNLPANWRLLVRAGHRPVKVQKDLFQLVKKELAERNPGINDEELTVLTRDYVSDPDFKVPPHCSGSAVDVEALDITTGELIDFGSPINEESDRSHTHTSKISPDQYENRLILLRAMLKANLAPLKEEWWHFSYGDQNWAAFYRKPKAIYGIKEPELLYNQI